MWHDYVILVVQDIEHVFLSRCIYFKKGGWTGILRFLRDAVKQRELSNMGVPYLHHVCTLLDTFQDWSLIVLLVRCELQNLEVRLPEHLLNWCLCGGPTRSLVPVLCQDNSQGTPVLPWLRGPNRLLPLRGGTAVSNDRPHTWLQARHSSPFLSNEI